ncbi:MAG: hypothetical protein HYU67_04525 [Flavobacteriia bacterium]|nr:hypothetical protein [Flavobacteriia bacterium]
MFKKKKPIAKVDDVKMAGAFDQQRPLDVKKIIKESNKAIEKSKKTCKNKKK